MTLLAGAAPARSEAQQQVAATTALVFDDVAVVDVEHGTVVPAQRIVIVGNRIRAVGDARKVAIPAGSAVVDAHSKYLIPGLWNMHIHIGPPLPGPEAARQLAGYLANGVTGIRDAGSPVPLDTLVHWHQEVLAGARIGPPRQILSGQAIDEIASCTRGAGSHTCVEQGDAADARQLVDSLKAAGASILKMYKLSKPMYSIIAAEARRLGLPFGGHAEGGRTKDWLPLWFGGTPLLTGTSPSEASALGASVIDHEQGDPSCQTLPARKLRSMVQDSSSLDFLRRLVPAESARDRLARCRAAAQRFRENGTWFVPTLVTYGMFRGIGSDEVVRRLSARLDAFEAGARSFHGNWLRDSAGVAPEHTATGDSPYDSVMALPERIGLPILAGTDLLYRPPEDAFAIHAELASLVAEGLSPLHALQAATLNPAKMLHATDSLGTVASGKLADLVLLDADPLVDITNTTMIAAVVANGRYFDRAALDGILAELRPRTSSQP